MKEKLSYEASICLKGVPEEKGGETSGEETSRERTADNISELKREGALGCWARFEKPKAIYLKRWIDNPLARTDEGNQRKNTDGITAAKERTQLQKEMKS